MGGEGWGEGASTSCAGVRCLCELQNHSMKTQSDSSPYPLTPALSPSKKLLGGEGDKLLREREGLFPGMKFRERQLTSPSGS